MSVKSLGAIVMTSLFWISVMSCASSSKLSHRSYINRVYHACDPMELARVGITNRLGKLCYSFCKEHKFLSSKCKTLGTMVADLNDEKQYDIFYATEMSCISMLNNQLPGL